MNCERCKINKATIRVEFLLQEINQPIFLCELCAKDRSIITSLIEQQAKQNNTEKTYNYRLCNSCGTTLANIMETKELGCADCFFCFEKEIDMLLSKRVIHTKFSDPLPLSAASPPKVIAEIVNEYSLKKELEKAIAEENFEYAAKIRDTLNRLNQKTTKDETNAT